MQRLSYSHYISNLWLEHWNGYSTTKTRVLTSKLPHTSSPLATHPSSFDVSPPRSSILSLNPLEPQNVRGTHAADNETLTHSSMPARNAGCPKLTWANIRIRGPRLAECAVCAPPRRGKSITGCAMLPQSRAIVECWDL